MDPGFDRSDQGPFFCKGDLHTTNVATSRKPFV